MTTTTTLRDGHLVDKYGPGCDTVLVNGNQALARARVLHLELDRRAGNRTAAYVSGCGGSPIGGFEQPLRSVRETLASPARCSAT